jgi:hypothetical protein
MKKPYDRFLAPLIWSLEVQGDAACKTADALPVDCAFSQAVAQSAKSAMRGTGLMRTCGSIGNPCAAASRNARLGCAVVRVRTPAKMHAPAGVSENLPRGQLDRAVVLADVRCSSRRRFVQTSGLETRTVLSVQTAGCPGSQQREKGLAKGRMGLRPCM